MKFLVTGVLGFIGSYFAKYTLRTRPDVSIIGVNRNSSQKNLARIQEIMKDPRFTLYYADFSRDPLAEIFKDVDCVFHFGAKTMVDHSIVNPQPFIESNIVGIYRILEEARRSTQLKLFLNVSTDEVYGSISEGAYKEDSCLNPSNPYSATKAAGDMLVTSYHITYGLPTIITRTENNYGPFQGTEKVMPVFVKKALANEPLPVYGDGKHRRKWLYVEDHCRALLHLLERGKRGEIYHVAGEQELENLELAKKILKLLGKPEDLIAFVPDHDIRPGHDRRYALDVQKLKSTGWKAEYSLDKGFKLAVDWYKNNQWWFL